MTIGRYAVVPTNGKRPGELEQSVRALLEQPIDRVFLVCNWKLRPGIPLFGNAVTEICQPPERRNISRWWNIGLDAAGGHAASRGLAQWDVAVVNDDAIVPPGWFSACTSEMRARNGAACGSIAHSAPVLVHTTPGPINLSYRMPGWAFILRGEVGLRANEELVWWYGDDDLDWNARRHGGTVIVPNLPVEHLHPNGQMTPELHEQAYEDRKRFVSMWGRAPW